MGRPIVELQIVRAAAALIVVAFHAQNELRHRGFADPFPDLKVGAFGVDLFFVLSGFIMVHASERLFGRRGMALPFMARRIARVVPLYWAFTSLFALIAVTYGHLPGHPKPSVLHILASFLFLPAARPDDGAFFPVYALGWTLNYEIFFYVCVAAPLGLRRVRAMAVVTTGIVGLVVLGRLTVMPWPLAYWGDPISLEFVFGTGIALTFRAGRRVPLRYGAPLLICALVAVVLYVPFIDSYADWRGLAWGVPAAIVVLTALGLEIRTPGPLVRAAARVGNASYSLYLVHSALFIAIYSMLSRILDPHAIPPTAYAAMLLLASVLAALALFRLFEAPVTQRLQTAISRSSISGRADAILARLP